MGGVFSAAEDVVTGGGKAAKGIGKAVDGLGGLVEKINDDFEIILALMFATPILVALLKEDSKD